MAYRDLDVYVWTTELSRSHHLWLYTIDDRFLSAGGEDFPDAAAALNAGLVAARPAVDRLLAQGVRPTKSSAGIRQREATVLPEDAS